MKFIVQWPTRPGSEAKDNLESSESLLKAFGSWTPPTSGRSASSSPASTAAAASHLRDHDLASIDEAVSQYLPWLDYDIIPVVDIADSVVSLTAGYAWARSAGGIG